MTPHQVNHQFNQLKVVTDNCQILDFWSFTMTIKIEKIKAKVLLTIKTTIELSRKVNSKTHNQNST